MSSQGGGELRSVGVDDEDADTRAVSYLSYVEIQVCALLKATLTVLLG